ncbi:MAG: hypothetical protein ACP5PS_01280, partial [Bacteroidales bacterium]
FFLLRHYKQQSYPKYVEMLQNCIWHIFDKRLLLDFISQPVAFESKDSAEPPIVAETQATPDLSFNNNTPFTSRRDKDSLQETLAETITQASQIDVSEDFEKKILPDIDFELDETIEIIKPTEADDESSLLKLSTGLDRNANILEIDESVAVKETEPQLFEPSNTTDILSQDNNVAAADTFIKKTSQQFALIDEFLEKLPHIKPQPVVEAAPATDISENSVEVHDDFMTETFARILVKQGSYDRAIEIYRKLILKFPEKNTYFASQIEEIEKLKNNPKP